MHWRHADALTLACLLHLTSPYLTLPHLTSPHLASLSQQQLIPQLSHAFSPLAS
jgi:hypothetical protein